MTVSFNVAWFSSTVAFYAPGAGLSPELHGDPVIGGETTPAVVFAPVNPGGGQPWAGGGAFVLSGKSGGRSENHRQPEGQRTRLVHTQTDPSAGLNPPVGVDWLCTWNGRLLRVTAPTAFSDGWQLWQTECVEVI